jgi:hypothetical protein
VTPTSTVYSAPKPTTTPVPSATASATATNTATATPAATSTSTPTATPTFTPSPTPCGPPWGYVTYIVQPGDSWYGLAARIGTPINDLLFANCATISTMLFSGQSIYVPHLPPPTWTPVPPTPTTTPTPTFTPSPTIAAPPIVIAAVEAAPSASYYGTGSAKYGSDCPGSDVTFRVYIQPAVGDAQVNIAYEYVSGWSSGGAQIAPAIDQGNGLYMASINNTWAQAAAVLKGDNGEIRWYATAVDAQGSSVKSDYHFNKVLPCPSTPIPTDIPTAAPREIPTETPTDTPTITLQ